MGTMSTMPKDVPLWLSIDTTKAKLTIEAGNAFTDHITLSMFQVQVPSVGKRWAVGTANHPVWMISPDVLGGQFVSLNWLDSLEANPIVLGKLPTRRTEPDFLLDRIVLSAVLHGIWTDGRGATYQFNSDATATWDGARKDVTIEVVDPSADVYFSLFDARRNEQRFRAERVANQLTLTKEDGTSLVLTLKTK